MRSIGSVLLAVFAICYTFACAMLFFGINVKAYFGPSGMTYGIQVIGGVMLIIGAAVEIYAHRSDSTLFAWFVVLVLVATSAKYISDHYVQLAVINGDSMLPAYHNMQITMVDKHSKDYKAGDVIVFDCQGLSDILVKRVVGVPGDILRIEDGTLYINGIASNEDTLFDYAGILEDSIELAGDEYIVFGDNTSISRDSRYGNVGIVKSSDIIGEIM